MILRIADCINKPLLLVFTFALLINSESLKAEAPPACVGTSVLATIEKQNPEQYKDILSEATEMANRDGIFWRLEKEGKLASYLYGTFHSTDPRITNLSTEAIEAIGHSTTVALEIAEVNPKLLQKYIAQNPQLFFLKRGPKLDSLLGRQDYETLIAVASKAGMPEKIVKLLKPWFASISFFQAPACEAARMASGLNVLDSQIGERARTLGKKLVSLETLDDQFSAFASIDQSHQITMLTDGIHNHDRLREIYVASIELYQKRQLGVLKALSVALGRDQQKSRAAMKVFNDVMLIKRNRDMFDKAIKLTEREGTFIAVGALHLVGDQGLVELYREAGYKVTKIN